MPVICTRTDCPRAVCAVAIVIHWVAVVINRINSVNVVNVTVIVIVHTVFGNLAGVCPHLPVQILMGIANTCVDDGNNYIGRTRDCVPCFGCANINACCSSVLAGILEAPKPALIIACIARGGGVRDQIVRFNRLQHAGPLQRFHPGQKSIFGPKHFIFRVWWSQIYCQPTAGVGFGSDGSPHAIQPIGQCVAADICSHLNYYP